MIRYKKNTDYFGEKALVDDLVFAITPDATARYAKLKAGECHVNAYPRPADLPEMQKDPSLKVINACRASTSPIWAFNAHEAAVRQEGGAPGARRWRSTATRSSRTSISAPARRPRR